MAILARNESGEVNEVFSDPLLQALWDGKGGYLFRESSPRGKNERGKEEYVNTFITFSRPSKGGRV
jgi:hypothetical protein